LNLLAAMNGLIEASPTASMPHLTWAQPLAAPRSFVLPPGASGPLTVSQRRRGAQSSTTSSDGCIAQPQAAWCGAQLRLRGRRREGFSALRQSHGDKDEHRDKLGSANAAEEEPWSIQQFISFISGVVASMLSATAFNQQREATKAQAKGVATAAASAVLAAGSGKSTRIVQQLGGSLLDAEAESPLFSLGPVPRCTAASDLRRPDRHFTIVTTAALPWLTGTAVNPLLRALSLARSGRPVVLVLPWIEQEDQLKLFPPGKLYDNTEEQEVAVVEWCTERAKLDTTKLPITFRWYSARYNKPTASIFPNGDIAANLHPGDPRDALILEEPEHLCWYHHGSRWVNLFSHVVGIVHTNYQDYIIAPGSSSPMVPAQMKEFVIFAVSSLVCSAYCDVNIKLSDTIMPLPNEVTQNVHGVRDEFIAVGDEMGKSGGQLPPVVTDLLPGKQKAAESLVKAWEDKGDGAASSKPASVYYLGKALYEKGWGELLSLLEDAGDKLAGLQIDGFGSGNNYEDIVDRAQSLTAREGDATSLRMQPGRDHADESIHGYSVLVNPSTSDVLCTVTVESLAMGKHIVLARHPSNRFFEQQFASRCHFFTPGDTDGFVAALKEAVAAGPPQPLPKELRYALTWEAATERLFDCAEVRVLSGKYERPSEAAASRLAFQLHYELVKDETVLADLIKEATLQEKTPWDTHLDKWRRENLGDLKDKASAAFEEMQGGPRNLKPHEKYLKERVDELYQKFTKT